MALLPRLDVDAASFPCAPPLRGASQAGRPWLLPPGLLLLPGRSSRGSHGVLRRFPSPALHPPGSLSLQACSRPAPERLSGLSSGSRPPPRAPARLAFVSRETRSGARLGSLRPPSLRPPSLRLLSLRLLSIRLLSIRLPSIRPALSGGERTEPALRSTRGAQGSHAALPSLLAAKSRPLLSRRDPEPPPPILPSTSASP